MSKTQGCHTQIQRLFAIVLLDTNFLKSSKNWFDITPTESTIQESVRFFRPDSFFFDNDLTAITGVSNRLQKAIPVTPHSLALAW